MTDRIELWVCTDCMLVEEVPDTIHELSDEEIARIESCWAALREDGYVGNDNAGDTVQRECLTCGHIGAEEDFPIATIDAGDDEPERVCLCPKCDSEDTEERDPGEEEFSWRECDCCGSTHGGARHRYALFPEPKNDTSATKEQP